MLNCAKCHNSISDDWVFNVEGESGLGPLHRACLQCVDCGAYLESTCYADPNSGLYCPRDYYRRFGPTCAGCGLSFAPEDLSTKLPDGLFYHPPCVVCSVCKGVVDRGQNIRVTPDGLLYCEDHSFMCQMKTTLNNNNNNDLSSGGDSGIEPDLKSDVKSPLMPPAASGGVNVDADEDSDPGGSGKDKESKRRGPRTTIKAKQLEVLRTVFAQTPKPTRLMREQLAKETGLPMRVIQVWFQNKRSKEKRLHQMRFMARGPFLPPNARRHHHPQNRAHNSFGANPQPLPFYDYGPGFEYHHDFNSSNFLPPPPHSASSASYMDYGRVSPSNSSCSGSGNPLHAFPSPPPQDFPPDGGNFGNGGGNGGNLQSENTTTTTTTTEQCYPRRRSASNIRPRPRCPRPPPRPR